MARRKCVTNLDGRFHTIGCHSVTKLPHLGNKTIPSGTQRRNDNRPAEHELSAGTAGKMQKPRLSGPRFLQQEKRRGKNEKEGKNQIYMVAHAEPGA